MLYINSRPHGEKLYNPSKLPSFQFSWHLSQCSDLLARAVTSDRCSQAWFCPSAGGGTRVSHPGCVEQKQWDGVIKKKRKSKPKPKRLEPRASPLLLLLPGAWMPYRHREPRGDAKEILHMMPSTAIRPAWRWRRFST